MIKSVSSQRSNHRILLSLLLIFGALCSLASTGCGSEDRSGELDPISLLQHYKKETPRHHPVDLVELDLGDEFNVTIPLPDDVDVYRVSFKGYLIVPKTEKDDLAERYKKYENRARDAIMMAAKKMNAEKNSDPYQAWLKSEILDTVSKLLKTRDIRDVVFTKFNFDRS